MAELTTPEVPERLLHSGRSDDLLRAVGEGGLLPGRRELRLRGG